MSDANPPFCPNCKLLEGRLARVEMTSAEHAVLIRRRTALIEQLTAANQKQAALLQEQGVLLQQATAINRQQEEAIRQLTDEITRLKRNSSNSNKPPSSDFIQPPKPPNGAKRRPTGGQPGHPRHQRRAFTAEDVNETRDHHLAACPDCQHALQPTDAAPTVARQAELVEQPVIVVEHRAHAGWCPICQKAHYAPLPATVTQGGLIDPRLQATIAWLKGKAHASYTVIAEFFKDVLGLELSRGLLAKRNQQTATALEKPVVELQQQLRREPVVNVDETGHKDPSLRRSVWTWVFATPRFTTFKLAASRGSKVLIEVLGKRFKGTVICDFFSAYRKFDALSKVNLQLCWAHLIREWKALLELSNVSAQRYATRVLGAIKRMFRWMHGRDQVATDEYQRKLRERWRAVLAAARYRPHYGEARKLGQRLRDRADQYGRFVEELAVEPTNNFGERQLRPVVIDRRITQGTRSLAGRVWCERIWTAAATCAQQGRSLFDYLCDAVAAQHQGRSAPSLLPV